MATEEDLTLRMRAKGGASTAAEVEGVTKSVKRANREIDGSSRSTRRAAQDTSVFTRALTIMKTRAVIATVIVAGLGLVLGAVVPAVLLLTAATLALGAVFAPVFALGAGAVQLFGKTAGTAGTAANELRHVLKGFKNLWADVIGPGATIVLHAVSDALRTLAPLLASLKGPLTTFAHFIASAMQIAATGIATLGPEINRLLAAAGPLLEHLATAITPLIGTLIDVAIAGMPVLTQIIDWLVSFSYWLRPAIRDLVQFGHSAQAANIVHQVFSVVAMVAKWLAHNLATVAQIAYQLYVSLKPVLQIVGGGLVFAFRAWAAVLDFVNTNFKWISDVLPVLVAGFLAYKAAVFAVAAATRAWILVQTVINLLMTANPIGLVITALAALAGGIYEAWKHSKTFREGVKAAWETLKASPIGTVVKWLANLVRHLWDARAKIGRAVSGIWDGLKQDFVDVVNFVIGKMNWLIRAFNNTLGRTPGVGDIGQIVPVGGSASGGTLHRRGRLGIPAVTGADFGTTRGLISHYAADPIRPRSQASGSRATHDMGLIEKIAATSFLIEATLVMPDGSVLAKQTLKASRKKKSTR